ncbi:unnamed protein product [Aspergillus oryzae]|nr:unnamed protein product [Aspergillus oryzae]GMF88464.1 unnamed protein product [Aspergillus oryzae]GMG00759.1 unnamed protein product [Aspergillus oryzae]GMG26190.1 unnamed protein product [Aspergillus oryzae]GMG49314.1 unnamed protein product [Aspergillus oryzae var. brunneus]
MIMRPVIGLIIILLGLAKDLDITSMMSIIMALIVFCLIWENITSLHCHAGIWEPWNNTIYPEQRVASDDSNVPVIRDESSDSARA